MTERSPVGPEGVAPPTPSQTIGPFFRPGTAWAECPDLVRGDRHGAVTIAGHMLDCAGDPVPDALVELWQADADGRFPPATGPGWTGFGRALVDADGGFRFVTVPPGRVDEAQAPHLDLSVFARGLLQRVVTRIYLPGDDRALAADPLLASLDPDRRATLVAAPDGPGAYRFDVHLQGGRETVFLAW